MAEKMPSPPTAQPQPQPMSLKGHEVPPERYALIAPHIQMLAATALAVSEALPLTANTTDFVRVLDSEGR